MVMLMNIDLTDLRLFLHIDEAGSITAGAQRACMTLASASERVRGMEASVGAALLLRGRRGVMPTEAGRALLHHAREVIRQMDLLADDLGEYGEGRKGMVRVLCNTSALSEHLPVMLSRFLATHPGISVDLEERASHEIAAAVRSQACDLGVLSDLVDLSGLSVWPIAPDPLTLVVPARHDWAARTSVSLHEVMAAEFVGLAGESALQRHIVRQARMLGGALRFRLRVGSLDMVCRMVGQGIGVGIVPKAVAQRCRRTAGIRCVRLVDAWADRSLVLCARDLSILPLYVRQLAEVVAPGSARS